MSEPLDPYVFFTDRDLGARFPEILAASGLTVRRHRDHFPHDCPDEVWLAHVARAGWVAITHDSRIRYKPNELAAVVQHSARLVVVVGKAPLPELAKHFVATAPRAVEFVRTQPAPWIAKVYQPSASDLARDAAAPGSVALWYPRKRQP